MGEKFERDDNHRYPRYLGVRAKAKAKLKVVASNV
jgi:hypothetical protein